MTTEQQLPKGWKKTTFGEIAQVVSGGTPNTKLGTNFAEKGKGISWITPADLSKHTDKFISNGARDLSNDGYKSCSAKILPAGTVLLSSRAPIGYVAIAQNELSTNQGFKNFILSDDILSEYAYYYLKSIKSTIESLGSGTTFLELSASNARRIPIIYPTSQETQQAIVNKIESLFDEIDEGIGRLKTAAQQIQQYRQSLLKNAFNGELTKEWRSKHADTLPSENELLAQIQTTREQHHAQQLADWQTAVSQWEQNGKEGKKPSKPKAPTQAVKFEDNFADLPSGWLESSLGDTTDVFVGSTPSRKNNEYWDGDISWVSSGEVNFSNILETKEKITNLGLSNSSTNIHPIGTVMLAMIGEGKTRGQAGILKIEACHNQNTAAIRVNKKYLLSEYLYYFFMFNYEQTRRIGSGNNQKALNKTIIENMSFPICSLTEQTQIVAILESKLTACDHLAAELAKQLKQAELLKQAVLKAAFSGGLLDK